MHIEELREERLGSSKEVDLGNIAVKTAALVVDLVGVVERVVAAPQDRILKLTKKIPRLPKRS